MLSGEHNSELRAERRNIVPQLVWDAVGERRYEAGVDHGVLYVDNSPGVAWNGLTSVSEKPSGGTSTAYYIDGEKYLNSPDAGEYAATIEAFTYPDEFEICEGTFSPYSGLLVTMQERKPFGLSYRTKVGDDVNGTDNAYKIHLVYNALAEPSQRANKTQSDAADLSAFSWDITTQPPTVPGFKRTAHYVIDSRRTDPAALMVMEEILYGTESDAPRLPDPTELLNIFLTNTSFVVIDNGDGTFTASGTDFEVEMLDDDIFQISTPGAVFIDANTYTLTSP
jgi:hypothetical protein